MLKIASVKRKIRPNLELVPTILLLIKKRVYVRFFDQLKKAYVYLVYIYAKTFFSIFVFCPKIDQKYTPVFYPHSPLKVYIERY